MEASQVFTGRTGHTPCVVVGFSETIHAGTVTTTTLILTMKGGTAILVTVEYWQVCS